MSTVRLNQKGYTLVEMIVGVAIIVILVAILSRGFVEYRRSQVVVNSATEVIALLEEARALTANSKDAARYGVHFETTKAVLFKNSYSAGGPGNEEYLLDPMTQISAITLSGGGAELLFERLTGEATKSGTVAVALADGSKQKIITIRITGIAELN